MATDMSLVRCLRCKATGTLEQNWFDGTLHCKSCGHVQEFEEVVVALREEFKRRGEWWKLE